MLRYDLCYLDVGWRITGPGASWLSSWGFFDSDLSARVECFLERKKNMIHVRKNMIHMFFLKENKI